MKFCKFSLVSGQGEENFFWKGLNIVLVLKFNVLIDLGGKKWITSLLANVLEIVHNDVFFGEVGRFQSANHKFFIVCWKYEGFLFREYVIRNFIVTIKVEIFSKDREDLLCLKFESVIFREGHFKLEKEDPEEQT